MAVKTSSSRFSSQQRVVLAGSEKAALSAATEEKPARPSSVLTVSVIVRRKKPLNAKSLGKDRLTRAQYRQQHAADPAAVTLVRAFAEVRRTLKPAGTFFLNLGDTYYSAKGRPHGRDDKHNGRQMMRRHLRAVDGPGLGLPRKSLIGIPWRVALALQDDGWTLRSSIIWQRPASIPEPTARDRPWRTFEYVFLFSKSPRYWFHRPGLVGEEDVWRIVARPENPGAHFAPYPIELVKRCLDCGCPQGGVVLDPFVGSGTTMIAALSRGSSAIGVDLKPEYSGYTMERIHRQLGAPPTPTGS